jgi:hypothetical protein
MDAKKKGGKCGLKNANATANSHTTPTSTQIQIKKEPLASDNAVKPECDFEQPTVRVDDANQKSDSQQVTSQVNSIERDETESDNRVSDDEFQGEQEEHAVQRTPWPV